MHTRTRAQAHTRKYPYAWVTHTARARTHMHMPSSAQTHTDTATLGYKHTHSHTHSRAHAHTRAHTHTHAHAHIHTRAHTHTHAHAHAQLVDKNANTHHSALWRTQKPPQLQLEAEFVTYRSTHNDTTPPSARHRVGDHCIQQADDPTDTWCRVLATNPSKRILPQCPARGADTAWLLMGGAHLRGCKQELHKPITITTPTSTSDDRMSS